MLGSAKPEFITSNLKHLQGCSVVKMVAKLFPIFLGVMLETAEHLESQTVQAAVRDQHTHIDRHVKIPHHWLAAGF